MLHGQFHPWKKNVGWTGLNGEIVNRQLLWGDLGGWGAFIELMDVLVHGEHWQCSSRIR